MQPDDKRRIKGEQSRQAIVDAAIACIASHGLRHATLERIARQAEVSRALVVFHFKSRDGMLTAVLNQMHELYSRGWDEMLAWRGPTGEKLLKLLEYDIGFAVERPDLLSVWHAFWGEARAGSLYRDVGHPNDERYEADLRCLIEALVEEGEYEDIDVEAVGTGLNSMLFGLWRSSHLLHDTNDAEAGLRALRVYLHKLFPKHY